MPGTQNRALQSVKSRRAKIQLHGANPLYIHDPEVENGVQLTTKQISMMFDITTMTIYNWRKEKKLPFTHLEGGVKPPVRYDEGAVLYWAEAHGIPIVNEKYR